MSSLTGMIQRREWKAVVRNRSEASVEALHLHKACKYDPPQSVIEAFVRANSRFRTSTDENGELPIHTACYYGASEEVIEFLAHWDIQSLQARSRVGNRTPLEIAQTSVWEYNGENQARIIRLLQKKSFPAFFDDLTGLPKKKAFEKWAHVSPYDDCYEFVFFIDIVGFKYLNDTGGQNVGDEAIKTYASSIERVCRTFEAKWASENSADSLTIDVFRVGGDEFVVVVKTAADAEESSCKRVWTAISSTLLPNLGSLKESKYQTFVRVGCSAGLVSSSEDAEVFRERAENLQSELKTQLKMKRGEQPLLSEFQAEGMSKVNICNKLLEWDPFPIRAECHQVVAQSMQTTVVRQEQKPKKSSVIDVYFHFQPPPMVKESYTAGVETEHISYLKLIEEQLVDEGKRYEKKWTILGCCRMILSNGQATTITNVLPHNNVQAIIWCAEGVNLNSSREKEGFIASLDLVERLPSVVVVVLKYSPQRAAKDLLDLGRGRGVHTVIWIRMDVYDQEPSIVLTRLFLPLCDAILTGTDLRAPLKDFMRRAKKFSPPLSDQDFGIEGANIPQQVHRNHGEEVRGLHAYLKGCEVCRTNVLQLIESESLRDLEVHSSDLLFLESIRERLSAAVENSKRGYKKICLQLSAPDKDGDATGLLTRTRAIAWETCKVFATNDLLNGVFRVASISELSSIARDFLKCALLWVDLQNSESSDAWSIDADIHHIRDCRRLLVIFTSDEKHFGVMNRMIDDMGLRDVHREETLSEQLPGTDICASSMHHCICVIPTRKEGCASDQPLLDEVLSDPAEFERAFRQIVLSFPTKLDDGAESSVEGRTHTNVPPIIAVYRDDNDLSIKVRVCFSDVMFLMRLRSRILSDDGTAKKLADAIPGDVNIRFDRSAFATVYEKTLLQFEKMTPHQREEMKKCAGERIVHIAARAGTGKTFLALNISLAFLRKHQDKNLLYASSSKALCYFFVKWLCKRPMPFTERKELLKRLFIMYPGEQDEEAKMVGVEYDERCGRLEQIEGKIDENKGGKVVIDEAHHVFDSKQKKMHPVASKAKQLMEKKFEVLIVSDISQSSSSTVDLVYPEEMRQVELTQVVRSSQRIVAGAMTYQLANKNLTHCAHDIEGPPLMTYIFDPEKHQREHVWREEIQVYAGKIVDAITDLLDEHFPKFDLHDRLAILVPNDSFRDNLKDILSESLGQKFHLNTALESSQSLNLSDADFSPETKRCIVLDSVANFHGQERLIVFGVDLDSPIEESGDVGLVRSQIYQAITRAQMVFCLINKSIKGGWFEWLQTMENNDGANFSFVDLVKFCNDAAADVVKRYATENAVSNSAVVARKDQPGSKNVRRLPGLEPTPEPDREHGSKAMPKRKPEREREPGSRAEPEHENDTMHRRAEVSDVTSMIRNLSVWDTSKSDKILWPSSGRFMPIKEKIPSSSIPETIELIGREDELASLETTLQRRRLEQEEQDGDGYNPESRKRKFDNHPTTPTTDDKGYLHFRRAEWFDLTEKEKTFVKQWNKAIKNGNSTNDLKEPDGFKFIDKRQDDASDTVDVDSSKKRRLTSEHVDGGADDDEIGF